jgi:hypothetical protein
MPSRVPRTFDKAVEAGHEVLSKVDARKHLKVRAFAPRLDGGCDAQNPGDKCSETNCIDGYKIVLYCDESGGCSRAVKVRC